MHSGAENVLADNHQIYWNYLQIPSQQVEGCEIVCTGIQTGWLNGVISHALAKEADVKIVVDKIVQYFQQKCNLPFSWWVALDKEPVHLAEALEKHHIVSLGDFSGMILKLDTFKPVPALPALAVEKISTVNNMTKMIKVLVDAYEADAAVGECAQKLFWEAAQKEPKVIHFLGSESDQAVTAGSMFIYQNVACIYHVGTIHNARKKGYASNLMSKMLETAQNMGCAASVLVSTPKGKNMYLRLGYEVNTLFHHYMKI